LTTSQGRRPRDPTGRRQTIIDAAIRVIADSGLAGLTHRRVAEVANVPVGSTTYYFKDLDELRDAALSEAARANVEGLDQWRQELAENADLPTTLARLTACYLAERDRYRALNELYAAASHRPELRRLARQWSDGVVALLEPRIGRHRAEMAAAFMDGAVLRALITDDAADTTALREALARLIDDDS
jgi:DNA-binding transcriptional regulator YbjK